MRGNASDRNRLAPRPGSRRSVRPDAMSIFHNSVGVWPGLIDDNTEVLEATPPRLDDYFAWTVEAHYAVNRKLDKPEVSVEEARATWAASARRPSEWPW